MDNLKLISFLIPISFLLNTAFAQFPNTTGQNNRINNRFLSEKQLQYFDFKTSPPPRIAFADTSASSNMNIYTKDGWYLFSYPKSLVQLKYGYLKVIDSFYGGTMGDMSKGGYMIQNIPYHVYIGSPRKDNLQDFIPVVRHKEKGVKQKKPK